MYIVWHQRETEKDKTHREHLKNSYYMSVRLNEVPDNLSSCQAVDKVLSPEYANYSKFI